MKTAFLLITATDDSSSIDVFSSLEKAKASLIERANTQCTIEAPNAQILYTYEYTPDMHPFLPSQWRFTKPLFLIRTLSGDGIHTTFRFIVESIVDQDSHEPM